MPIGTKSKIVKTTKTSKSASTTPHVSHKEIPVAHEELVELHGVIEDAKVAADALKTNKAKQGILADARDRIFNERAGAYYIDLGDGRELLLKPSTRRYPLAAEVASAIENIIDESGHDAGDYYHESHSIILDADTIHDRLGEDEYMKFQADLAEFMAGKRGKAKVTLGDCWEMKEQVIAKPDFFTTRHALPVEVNLSIENAKPSTISVEAKRSL